MTNEKMLQKMYEYKDMFKDSIFDSTIAELQEDIRTELQKKKGNTKRDTLLKKVVKSKWSEARDMEKCYHPVGDKYGFTDGYRAYVLNDSYGYENIVDRNREPLNFKACKPEGCNIELKIDRVELKLFAKEMKAKKIKSPLYVIENDKIKIGFNGNFLMEFLEMFDTDTIYCKAPKVAAYYENEQGEWGLLFPVRLPEND